MMRKVRFAFTFAVCTVFICALWSVSAVRGADMQVYKGNTYYYTVENSEVTITAANAKGDVVIPSSLGGYPVKKIGKEAFSWETDVTSVTIPEGIEELEDYAFSYYDEEGLWDEDYPEIYLNKLSLPKSLKKIGSYVFNDVYFYCEIELPENIEYIGAGAFYNASIDNKELKIPASVEYIGNSAFKGNYFKKYIVEENNAYYSSDEAGALYNKDKTVIIDLPSANEATNGVFTIPDTVKNIGNYCFYENKRLKQIIIPDSVTEIENHAIYNCNSLERIVIPDSVEKIGDYALSYYYYGYPEPIVDWLHEIYYEGTVEQWNKICGKMDPDIISIHYSCNDIVHTYTSEITKNPTCKSYGTKTFTCSCGVVYEEDIVNLLEDHSKLYSERVSKPAGLNKGGTMETVCEKCGVVSTDSIAAIRKIDLSSDKCGYSGSDIRPVPVFTMWGTINRIYKNEYKIVYPEHSKDVGKYTLKVELSGRYEGTEELEYTVLPSTAKNLKVKYDGKGILYTWDKQEEATGYKINFSYDGVKKEEKTLAKDTTSYYVPSVYNDGYAEFDKWCSFSILPYTELADGEIFEASYKSTISEYYLPETTSYTAKEGTYKYFIFNKQAYIVSADVKGDVTIPAKLGGYKTVGIMSYAFKELANLKSVVIPEGIKQVGAGIFSNSGVTQITIPSTLTQAEDNAFFYCKKLKKIIVSENNPAFCSDENGVLYNKDKTELIIFPAKNKLETFNVPGGVAKICNNAFYSNTALKKVALSEGVKQIGDNAFQNCSALSEITLPDSLEKIGEYTFSSCKKLKEIIIPDKVTKIPGNSFAYCFALEKVVLSAKTEKLCLKAFYGCIKLESIVIPDTVTYMANWVFYECRALSTVYYTGDKETWEKVSGQYEPFNNYTLMPKVHYNYEDYVHAYSLSETERAPTCVGTGYGTYICPCGSSYKSTIPALGHSFTTVYPAKATTEKDGIAVSRCEVCSYSENREIYKVDISLESKKLLYSGEKILPRFTLKSGSKALTEGADYTVIYSDENSTAVGEYTVTFKSVETSEFEFEETLSYSILPGVTTEIRAKQSTSAIKFSWQAVPGATGYTLYRYNYTKGKWVKLRQTTDTSCTISSLPSGTKYRLAVRAYTQTNDGTLYVSASFKALTTSTKPAAPKYLNAGSYGKGKANLSWGSVSGETGFQIYYSQSKNGTYKKLTNCKANTSKYTASSLARGKTFYFKVRAYRNIGGTIVYGPFSAVRSVKIK